MRLNPTRLPPECFDFRVSGIPCFVCVTLYDPGTSAKLTGHPDTWEAPDPGEFEFELFDRKGYRAKWLEEKITDSVSIAVEDAYLKHRRKYD